MKYKWRLIFLSVMAVFVVVGCGLNNALVEKIETVKDDALAELSSDNESQTGVYNKYIVSMVEQVVECLDAKDSEKLASLYMDYVTEETMEEINRFMGEYSCSESVLADCGSYMREGNIIDNISYDRYCGICAIIITTDNAYRLYMVFDNNKKEDKYYIERMMITTGKSEAYENFDYYSSEYLEYTEQFVYYDCLDEDFDSLEEYSCYEVIFGEILASRGESTEVTLEEAEALVGENITEEQLIEKLGKPRASVKMIFSYDYYTMSGESDSDSYIMFKSDEDGNLIYCKDVSKKYPAWVDVK
jgi:hypothetical protein